eukprot:CAMPEP_0118695928 /NCGR_PEP_ID=MMETSP0800-20121206/13507_1 /TAXON_ID=210618 ORGANISM="Striatella unipunctata, Strain CCMP2910" /NCGR_SAMPLE_ID=MMETSP0800 /ASSEMBLY_ACC=CAM_ASM_000638 /LENGTH=246 /DNA_ID=CAMNT_0006594871 /DNA_START=55 /DNA_END=795 /DNA_ORIENTATION=-
MNFELTIQPTSSKIAQDIVSDHFITMSPNGSYDSPSAQGSPRNEHKGKRIPHSARKKWRKPKDKPRRPLSAYNLFFRHEREQLLKLKKDADSRSNTPPKEGETLGIGFGNLARFIATKWRNIDCKTRSYFDAGAEEEKCKYKVALKAWNEGNKRDARFQVSYDTNALAADQDHAGSFEDILEYRTGGGGAVGFVSSPFLSVGEGLPSIGEFGKGQMERVMASVEHLKSTMDQDFVDFVSSLDFSAV